MRNWRTFSILAFLVPVLSFWGTLEFGVNHAAAAEVKAAEPAEGPLEDVTDVVDQMIGKVPAHHNPPAEPVNYQEPPLKIEFPLFIFTLVLFAGFVLLMRSAAWNPLIAGLDARESRIVKAERDARAARIDIEQLTARAESRLAEVQNEVKAIVSKARAEAEARKLEIVSQAEADAQRIKHEALQQIAHARQAALSELEESVGQQVAFATEQIAGRRL